LGRFSGLRQRGSAQRTFGGEWVTDDADPEGEINIKLQLPDGTRC